MITLYLIRHGQTVWNSSGRYQGRTDVALSEKGIAQAEKTKERFRPVSLDGVISSPLKRAAHTAKGIAQTHGLPLETDARLEELSFGDWEGKTYDEIEKIWPGMIEAMYHDAGTMKLPHGESFAECQKRCMEAINDIIKRGDNLALSNASISQVNIYPGDMNMLYMLNDTSHLGDLKSGS